MLRKLFCLFAFATILCTSSTGLAGLTSLLDSAQDFAVLGGSTVTNTGSSIVNGDIGIWPGTAITGYDDITHTGTLYQGGAANGVAGTAQGDLTTAYNALAGMPVSIGGTLANPDLGGLILFPGVYRVPAGTTNLLGTLTLDGNGDVNAAWVFQMTSTLITSPSSVVNVINTGSGAGVYWQVGSSATIDIYTAFQGNILADQMIALNTGATLNGGALARIAAVTMQGNTINTGFNGGLAFDDSGDVVPIPVPGALLLACSGMGSLFAFRRRFFSKS